MNWEKYINNNTTKELLKKFENELDNLYEVVVDESKKYKIN